MDRVKKLISAGLPISDAVKAALGMTVTAFAEKHRLPRSITAEALNGARVATSAQLDALVAELGGTREEWRELLWLAAKPAHVRLEDLAACA